MNQFPINRSITRKSNGRFNQCTPVLARSPQGEIVRFPSVKSAAEETGHPIGTVGTACHRLTRTERGWNFKRERDSRPFAETKVSRGKRGRRGMVIEGEDGMRYPNIRTMALLLGVSPSTVHRKIKSGIYKQIPDAECIG